MSFTILIDRIFWSYLHCVHWYRSLFSLYYRELKHISRHQQPAHTIPTVSFQLEWNYMLIVSLPLLPTLQRPLSWGNSSAIMLFHSFFVSFISGS